MNTLSIIITVYKDHVAIPLEWMSLVLKKSKKVVKKSLSRVHVTSSTIGQPHFKFFSWGTCSEVDFVITCMEEVMKLHHIHNTI